MTYPKHIPLTHTEWRLAWWRKIPALPKPQTREFDWASIQKRHATLYDATKYRLNWNNAKLSIDMSKREAHVWLETMLKSRQRPVPPLDDVESYREDYTLKEFTQAAGQSFGYNVFDLKQFIIPLCVLFPLKDVLTLLVNSRQYVFAHGWAEFWLPYATEDELEEIRTVLRPLILASTQSNSMNLYSGNYYTDAAMLWGAFTNCGEELLQIIEAIPSDTFVKRNSANSYRLRYSYIQSIILGLPSAQHVVTQMKRLNLPLMSTYDARHWLAHTEHTELDYLKQSILQERGKSHAKSLINVLGLVETAETAGHMLEIMVRSKSADAARKWLDAHPELAIEGIIPLAKGQGNVASAAVDYLRGLMRSGHDTLITQKADEAILKRVVDRTVTLAYPPFDNDSTPDWLAEYELKLKKTKGVQAPRWINAAELPPIVIDNHVMNENQVKTLMLALKYANLSKMPHPMLEAVTAHADRHLLDGWAWELLERWQINGHRKTEYWAIDAVTALGTENLVHRLATAIKSWMREKRSKQTMRAAARHAIGNLAIVASDVAFLQLLQLHDMANVPSLRIATQEAIQSLANRRNMSLDALYDRAVPDCGLDKHGTTVFDYGRRQFTFVMSGDMLPTVRDAQGKTLKTLPKPGKLDQAKIAEPAYERWKFVTKQIRETVETQTARLEQAMVHERRWTVAEFRTIFLEHPLLQHVVKPLVWGIYAPSDTSNRIIQGTFRVTERGELVDAHDEPLTIPREAHIGIVHPLHLTQEACLQWQEVLLDYELIPPFEQLNRQTTLLDTLALDTNIHDQRYNLAHVVQTRIHIARANHLLPKLGYEALPYPNYGSYARYYSNDNVTAILKLDYENGKYGYHDARYISRCSFVAGHFSKGTKGGEMLLSDISPLVLSEVVRDLTLRLK
jgi:hypothetical protein